MTELSRKARIVIFAAFALAIGVAIAHEYGLPEYCLRVLAPKAETSPPNR